MNSTRMSVVTGMVLCAAAVFTGTTAVWSQDRSGIGHASNTDTLGSGEEARQRSGAAALEFLNLVQDEFHRTFPVYTDFCAGGNHYIPNGWMGDVGDIVLSNPADTTRPHSGLTSHKFAYIPQGTSGKHWAGVYWLPSDEGWQSVRGYDLTGAKRLSFWARGEVGGERINFLVGGFNRKERNPGIRGRGSSGPFELEDVTLGREWREYFINIPDGEDLSNIIGGFGWTTGFRQNSRGCTFYLDDIEFQLDRTTEPGFLLSYQPASLRADRSILNAAFLYDNALVLLAYLSRGSADDVRRARQIGDAFVLAQHHDRGRLDGRLRNAYRSGDVRDTLLADAARLPGWTDPLSGDWIEDELHVSSYTGNLAWAMIALIELSEITRDTTYLQSAIRLGEWIETNCRDSRGQGGYTGGLAGWVEASATRSGQRLLEWKSTEHSLDLSPAFRRLYRLTGDEQWKERSERAEKFVRSMWDDSLGTFLTGTLADGITVNRQSFPLDVDTWALLAFGADSRYTTAITWLEDSCMAKGCPEDSGFTGFDFNTDRDGVWMEGTAQMALVYRLAGQMGKYQRVMDVLMEAQRWTPTEWTGGLLAACHDSVSTGFDWLYPRRVHIGATAWLVFALQGYNPYWGRGNR